MITELHFHEKPADGQQSSLGKVKYIYLDSTVCENRALEWEMEGSPIALEHTVDRGSDVSEDECDERRDEVVASDRFENYVPWGEME